MLLNGEVISSDDTFFLIEYKHKERLEDDSFPIKKETFLKK